LNESDPARLAIIPSEGGEIVKSFRVPTSVFRGAVRISWTPDGTSVVYRDLSQGLWKQSLDEREPQTLEGFEETTIRNFAWSPDGRDLAYVSGPATQEINLIENFR
jgi:Tol biopolymer transport system component